MKTPTNAGLAITLCVAATLIQGCGGTTDENLSSTAAADSAKLQQAQAEVQEAASKASEAEAAKLKGVIKVEEQSR